MRKTKTGPVAGLVVALALSAAPALAADRIVQGVDWGAVPWATFCPGVKPVALHTGAGSCAISHPASQRQAKWDGLGMGVKEPKPDCARLAEEYRLWTTPKRITGGKRSDNPDVTWGFCQNAFALALNLRAKHPERFDEPFDRWRQRYFGAYLAREGK